MSLAVGDERVALAKLLKMSEIDTATPKVNRKHCRYFTGYTNHNGYGKIMLGGSCHRAHRLAFRLHTGKWPNMVLHRCAGSRGSIKNRSCVEVAHLYDGTSTQNQHDRKKDGTECLGVDHGRAKLTDAKVRRIREIYAKGRKTQRVLAEKYDVSPSRISYLVNRKSWRHVK